MIHDDANDVREALRPTRLPIPDDVDRRLRERLAENDGEFATPERAGRASLQTATLVACGVLVAIGTAWLASERAADTSPETTLGGTPAQDPIPKNPRAEPPAPSDPAVPAGNLFATAVETLKASPRLAVVRIANQQAEILRWVGRVEDPSTDELFVGKKLWILPRDSAAPAGDHLSFIERITIGADPSEQGGTWIVDLDHPAFSTQQPSPEREPTRLLRGLPCLATAPPVDLLPGDRLQGELLHALDGSDQTPRRAAALALLTWGGLVREGLPSDSLWPPMRHEGHAVLGKTPERLLDLADSDSTIVRLTLAKVLPGYLGPRGKKVLCRLALDRIGSVRRQAQNNLLNSHGLSFSELGDASPGTWWQFTDPDAWPEWKARLIDAAAKEGITDELGIWKRQFDKGRDPNSLFGALGLAESGNPKGIELLRPLATHRDGRVRAAAASGRAMLGDQTAWAVLRDLCDAPSAKDASYAVEMLRRHQRMESLDVLEHATKASHPLVRALAAAGMVEMRHLAEHRVDVRIREMAKSEESELMRTLIGSLDPAR